jgi:hypothetical protein
MVVCKLNKMSPNSASTTAILGGIANHLKPHNTLNYSELPLKNLNSSLSLA